MNEIHLRNQPNRTVKHEDDVDDEDYDEDNDDDDGSKRLQNQLTLTHKIDKNPSIIRFCSFLKKRNRKTKGNSISQ